MWRVGYVHDNHKREGVDWKFSTHRLFVAEADAPSWLEVDATLRAFGGLESFKRYMAKRLQRNALDTELRTEGVLF